MSDRTLHELNPTTDERDLTRRHDCELADHLPLTYNPMLGCTYCRCGGATYPGDRAPKHSIVCRYERPEIRTRYGHVSDAVPGLCSFDCERAKADGLPRDYDPALETPGQTDLLALLEDAS